MKTRVTALMQIVALCGGVNAAAQDVVFFRAERTGLDPAAAAGQAVPFTFDLPIDLLGVEPLDVAEPVTGSPYSAAITTEIVQPLADGNRIERRSTSAVARDGQGRVRREQQLAAIGRILPQGEVQVVTISDPVAQVHYSLDAGRKIAVHSPLPFIKRIDGPGRPVGAGVRVLSPAAGGVQTSGRLPSVVAGGLETSGNVRTESLGAKQIEGVEAEGTRTTVTIPAGAIGNQGPIDIVSERWYSPELRAVVFSRRADPRFGETTYRMENIVRAEPSADLFQVPAEYTIEVARPFPPMRTASPAGVFEAAPAPPR